MFYITEIDCGPPPNGNNTVPVPANLTLKYMDRYNYTCLPGYETQNFLSAFCSITGTFFLENPLNCYSMFWFNHIKVVFIIFQQLMSFRDGIHDANAIKSTSFTNKIKNKIYGSL